MLRLAVGKVTDYGLPEPDHDVLDAHPTVSDDLLTRLGHGDITVKPNIDRFEGSKVFFTDGTAVEADVVVYCTGYRISFPFLDEAIVGTEDNHVDLYRRVVPPGHPGLYFIGLLQPLGAIMPLAEAQAHWVAELITGEVALPSVTRDAGADRDVRRGPAPEVRRLEAAHDPGRRGGVPRRAGPGAPHPRAAPIVRNDGTFPGLRDRSGTIKKSGLTVCWRSRHAGRVSTATRVPQEERTRAMRARLLEATVDCLVEQRLQPYVDHAGVRAGRGVPGRPAAPLPDQERPGRGRRRAPDRGPGRGPGRRRRAAPHREAADPRGAADARRPLHGTGLHRRARAVGGRPHRRDAAGRGGASGAAGRPRDPPAHRRAARGRRVPPRRPRARPGDPRPGAGTRSGQHDLRRRPSAYPHPGPLGDHARRRAGCAGPTKGRA